MRHRSIRFIVVAATAAATLLGLVPSASARADYAFTTPVFGLTAGRHDVLFAADAGAGIVRLQDGEGRLIARLPGVTDATFIRPGRWWALTSAKRDKKLYRIVAGRTVQIANLGRFEHRVNPDGGILDSNPFDLAKLGSQKVLIADAAANAVLIANRNGKLDWVATLPSEPVSTANAKSLAGCPNGPDDICSLPDQIPAEPVATSVEVGPDGAWYVTELKGFPAPVGESRIWRIEPGTRHARCEEGVAGSPCSVVADGFTSILDLTFGPDGTAYVVELDEASWFAVELAPNLALGGTVNTCTTSTAPWSCTAAATGLTTPTAVAVNEDGPFVAVASLIPGQAAVVPLAS
jgi:hypothetical protein